MAYPLSKQGALPTGLSRPELDTTFLPFRILPLAGEAPCIGQVTFHKAVDSFQRQNLRPSSEHSGFEDQCNREIHRGQKCDTLSLWGKRTVLVKTKALSLHCWPGCWANNNVKQQHEWFSSDSSSTFAVFILQKEKDIPQTKKITSMTSIPRGLFCFSSGRQEDFSTAGEGRQRCEVTGWGCTQFLPKQWFSTLC